MHPQQQISPYHTASLYFPPQSVAMSPPRNVSYSNIISDLIRPAPYQLITLNSSDPHSQIKGGTSLTSHILGLEKEDITLVLNCTVTVEGIT